jgi:hypothetical protein
MQVSKDAQEWLQSLWERWNFVGLHFSDEVLLKTTINFLGV